MSAILEAIDRERTRRKWTSYRLAKEAKRPVGTIQAALARRDATGWTLEAMAAALGFEIRLVPKRRKG